MPKQRFAWMLAVAFLAASLAQAGTFYVDSTIDEVDALPGDGACATSIGTCTLRAAIQETNAFPGEDVIEVPTGDYVLTIPGSGEDAASTGDLDITDDLILTGAGLDETVIDGAGLDRVFDIPWLFALHSFPVVELAGVTVLGGDAEGGGGISVDSADLSIFDSAVEDNLGSGIDVLFATLLVSGSVVEANSSDGSGGGIFAHWSGAAIEDSTIQGNYAAGEGGGVAAGDSDCTIRDSVIAENSATNTGGLFLGESNSGHLIERTTISNNSAEEGAGGVTVGSYSDTQISSSTVAGNQSDSGAGGVRVDQSSRAAVDNTTISGNTGFEGGGFRFDGGAAQISASTIVDNYAAQTGGGISIYSGPRSPVGVKNSILAKNSASLGGPDCFVEDPSLEIFFSEGHNILGDVSDCDFAATPSDQVGVAPNPIDPLLGPLADNGGPTFTHALLPGSPAIDAIPVADCTYDDDGNPGTPEVPLATDQRGVGRPQGVACDVGAFELEQPTPTPTPTPSPTATPTPTPLPLGDIPMCKTKAGGKQVTKLVAPSKVQKLLDKGLSIGECPEPRNGRLMCKSKRRKLASVLVPERKVQRLLDKGLTLGVCRAP